MATTQVTVSDGINRRTMEAEPSSVAGWLIAHTNEMNHVRFVGVREKGDHENVPGFWEESYFVVSLHKPRRFSGQGRPRIEVTWTGYRGASMEITEASLLAEILELAALASEGMMETARQEAEEQAKRDEAARIEREKQRKREAEERAVHNATLNEWNEEVQELLQWQLGERVRLLRWHMRATVFGTIDDVSLPELDFRGKRTGRIYLTTEKGKSMMLKFDEIEVFQLRSEDGRTYTPVELPDHPYADVPNRRDRRAIAGGTGKHTTVFE